MIFDNNSHIYVTIKKRIPADYDVPYNDGSRIDKKSKMYKDLLKRDRENWEFLKKYVESGEKLVVSILEFPNRDGSRLDSLRLLKVYVWDDVNNKFHYFYSDTEEDETTVKSHERYVCDFSIDKE